MHHVDRAADHLGIESIVHVNKHTQLREYEVCGRGMGGLHEEVGSHGAEDTVARKVTTKISISEKLLSFGSLILPTASK